MAACLSTVALITSVVSVAFALLVAFHGIWRKHVDYGNFVSGENNKGVNVLEYMEKYMNHTTEDPTHNG